MLPARAPKWTGNYIATKHRVWPCTVHPLDVVGVVIVGTTIALPTCGSERSQPVLSKPFLNTCDHLALARSSFSVSRSPHSACHIPRHVIRTPLVSLASRSSSPLVVPSPLALALPGAPSATQSHHLSLGPTVPSDRRRFKDSPLQIPGLVWFGFNWLWSRIFTYGRKNDWPKSSSAVEVEQEGAENTSGEATEAQQNESRRLRPPLEDSLCRAGHQTDKCVAQS